MMKKVFSVKNEKKYNKPYYTLIYSVFIEETKEEALEKAKARLDSLDSDFDLKEWPAEYHKNDTGELCGELEPTRETTVNGGFGPIIVYRCANCKAEIDTTQSECFFYKETDVPSG